MAKTFNDFMIECAVYPYSQAHFELMKECSELELTAQFLESQQFMAENHNTLFGESVQLDPGYLTESADDQTITVMTEKFEERLSGVWTKIVNGVKNLIKTLRNLFLRISAKFDENTKTGSALLAKFNSGELDEQSARHLLSVMEKHTPNEGFIIPEGKSQPFASKIKFSGFGDKVRNQLAVALSTTTVVLGTPGAKANSNAALDIRDIRSIVNAFKGTVKNESALSGCKSQLQSAINDSINNGLTLPCSNGYLNRCAEDLKKIQEAFENEGKVVKGVAAGRNADLNAERKAADAEGKERPKGDGGMKVASDIYKSLTTCIGATTKMYLELHNYRIAVVKELSSLVPNAAPKQKKDSGKGNEEGEEK